MSRRDLALPLATLSLVLGSACRDPIVGDWELTEADGQDWPLDETYTDDGVTYSYEAEGLLTVDPTLEAEFEIEFAFEGGGYSYHETYSGDGEVTVVKARSEYEIEIEDDFNLEFTCTRDGDYLECEDDDGVDFEFTRLGKR